MNDESRLGDEWDALGRRNAMGVILTREGRAGEWEFEEFLATGRAEVARFIAELSKVAPALPRRRALDFGCGIGRVTLALSEHFEHVTGVDVAASMRTGRSTAASWPLSARPAQAPAAWNDRSVVFSMRRNLARASSR